MKSNLFETLLYSLQLSFCVVNCQSVSERPDGQVIVSQGSPGGSNTTFGTNPTLTPTASIAVGQEMTSSLPAGRAGTPTLIAGSIHWNSTTLGSTSIGNLRSSTASKAGSGASAIGAGTVTSGYPGSESADSTLAIDTSSVVPADSGAGPVSGQNARSDATGTPTNPSHTTISEASAQSIGTPQPTISSGNIAVTAISSGFVINPSSGALPVTTSPGGSPVTVGSAAVSLGSSGALVVGTTSAVLPSMPGTNMLGETSPLESNSSQNLQSSGGSSGSNPPASTPPQTSAPGSITSPKHSPLGVPPGSSDSQNLPPSKGPSESNILQSLPPSKIPSRQTVPQTTSFENVHPGSSASQGVASSEATVITSAMSGSIIVQTFLPTTISSLIRIQTPQFISTTITMGSTTSIVPFIVGSGGVAWGFPSQASNSPFLIPPTDPPIAFPDLQTTSSQFQDPRMSQATLTPAQLSSSTGPTVTPPDELIFTTTQDRDQEWITEGPLPTITTTTNPIVMSTISSVTKDGHNDDGGGHHPVFWHPHCIIFCPKGCSHCGIQLNLGPGIYPRGTINPPPGFNKDNMPAITIHKNGDPEYDSKSDSPTSPSATSDGSASSTLSTSVSSSTNSSSSTSSSSVSACIETLTQYDYSTHATLDGDAMSQMASAIDLAWSSDIKILGLYDSLTSQSTSSSSLQSVAPSELPAKPSPTCQPEASGGMDPDLVVSAYEDFCAHQTGTISKGSQPVSKTYNGGIHDIRLTLSWHDTGNGCPQSISPAQNGGKDCNAIFGSILTDCAPKNDPSKSRQNGGSFNFDCGEWFLSFDTGNPDVLPSTTTTMDLSTPSGQAGVSPTSAANLQ